VATVLSGTTIGQFRESNRLIDIVVRQPLEERSTMSVLANANVATSGAAGAAVAAGAHRVRVGAGRGLARRAASGRSWCRRTWSTGIQGPTVSGQVSAQLDGLRAKLPAGYRIKLEGAAADSAKAEASIAANVPLVLFIVFTLLMLQLHSFSRALLVFLTGPLGVAGAAMALLVLGRPFGFVANLGVIALFGMIIRNSVILVDQIEQDIATARIPGMRSSSRRCGAAGRSC
jgi:multidrug efflux pump